MANTQLSIEEALGVKELSKVFWWNYLVDATKYDIYINQGGTNSGKTYSILQILGLKACYEKNKVITVVGVTLPNLRIGAIRDWENIIKQSPFIKSQISRHDKTLIKWEFKSGSCIEFKSYETALDAQSGKRDKAFFTEVNNISKGIFTEVKDRVSEEIYVDFNPNARFYIHDIYESNPRAKWIFSNFTHNPHCPERVKSALKEYRENNPSRWRVMGQGALGKSEDNVYTNWGLVEKWPENGIKIAGAIDWGFNADPTAIGRCCLYRGEIYLELLVFSKKARNRAIANKIKLLEDKYIGYELEWVADNSNPEGIEILSKDFGIFVTAYNKPSGSVLSGITLLQDYRINVVDTTLSKYVVEELENYVWKKQDGNITNTPVDKFNHVMDLLRYYALTQLNEPEQPDYDDPGVEMVNI